MECITWLEKWVRYVTKKCYAFSWMVHTLEGSVYCLNFTCNHIIWYIVVINSMDEISKISDYIVSCGWPNITARKVLINKSSDIVEIRTIRFHQWSFLPSIVLEEENVLFLCVLYKCKELHFWMIVCIKASLSGWLLLSAFSVLCFLFLWKQ